MASTEPGFEASRDLASYPGSMGEKLKRGTRLAAQRLTYFLHDNLYPEWLAPEWKSGEKPSPNKRWALISKVRLTWE